MEGDSAGQIHSPAQRSSPAERGAGDGGPQAIRLLFVDPAQYGRDRFADMLAGYPFLRLRSVDHLSASALQPDCPDVVVVQAPPPGSPTSGFSQTIARASTLFPRAAVLVLNGDAEHRQRDLAMLNGVAGFLSREALPDSMAAAILLASRGLCILPRPALDQLRHAVRRGPGAMRGSRRRTEAPNGSPALTGRQQQVVQLLLEGLSNKEIARRLGITESTVKVHVRSIMGRAGVVSRTQLVLSVLKRPD